MITIARNFAIACCAVVALSSSASAQWAYGQRPIYGQMPLPINRNPMIAPGLSLQQYAYNISVLGRAYRTVPPYLLGYNPYPRYMNYGPVYGARTFTPALYTGYVPTAAPVLPYTTGYALPNYYRATSLGYMPYYGGNAYTGGYTAGGIDPFTGLPIY